MVTVVGGAVSCEGDGLQQQRNARRAPADTRDSSYVIQGHYGHHTHCHNHMTSTWLSDTGNTQGDMHDAGMPVYSDEDGDGDMVCTSMVMSIPPNTWEPVRSSDQRRDAVGVEVPGSLVHSLQESTVVPAVG